MKIEIQKVVQPLALNEYQPEYGDAKLMVWVNPPKSMTDERMEHLIQGSALRKELDAFLMLNREGGAESVDEAKERIKEVLQEMKVLADEMIVWLAQIWSQGPEETRMSAEELTEFMEKCNESDPVLYSWLLDRTIQMIRDYRSKKKKA